MYSLKTQQAGWLKVCGSITPRLLLILYEIAVTFAGKWKATHIMWNSK